MSAVNTDHSNKSQLLKLEPPSSKPSSISLQPTSHAETKAPSSKQASVSLNPLGQNTGVKSALSVQKTPTTSNVNQSGITKLVRRRTLSLPSSPSSSATSVGTSAAVGRPSTPSSTSSAMVMKEFIDSKPKEYSKHQSSILPMSEKFVEHSSTRKPPRRSEVSPVPLSSTSAKPSRFRPIRLPSPVILSQPAESAVILASDDVSKHRVKSKITSEMSARNRNQSSHHHQHRQQQQQQEDCRGSGTRQIRSCSVSTARSVSLSVAVSSIS